MNKKGHLNQNHSIVTTTFQQLSLIKPEKFNFGDWSPLLKQWFDILFRSPKKTVHD